MFSGGLCSSNSTHRGVQTGGIERWCCWCALGKTCLSKMRLMLVAFLIGKTGKSNQKYLICLNALNSEWGWSLVIEKYREAANTTWIFRFLLEPNPCCSASVRAARKPFFRFLIFINSLMFRFYIFYFENYFPWFYGEHLRFKPWKKSRRSSPWLLIRYSLCPRYL